MSANMSKKKSKQLINDATKDDRQPPPGYIMAELASRSSTISESAIIEEALLKKLAKPKPYVKYKALRIVRYVCENGSSYWRRSWQRHTDKLRDCQQFRGPPDPIYGDTPFEQVRQAAKEAMTSVFQTGPDVNVELQKRIHGKSDSRGNEYNGPSNQKPEKESRWKRWGKKDKVEEKENKTKSYEPRQTNLSFESNRSTYNANQYSVHNPHKKLDLNAKTTRGDRKRERKHVGGEWSDDEQQQSKQDSRDESNSRKIRRTEESSEDDREEDSYSYQKQSSSTSKVKSDGRYEKKWLADIIKSGGIGAKIPDLPKHVRQFENLSKSHILSGLDRALKDDGNWQKIAKALTLIQGLVNGTSSSDIVDYFQDSPENLLELQKNAKTVIKKKAKKLIERFGLEGDNQSNEDANQNEQPQYTEMQEQEEHEAEDDLIGIGNDEPPGDDILNFTKDLLGDKKEATGSGDDEDEVDFGGLNVSTQNENNGLLDFKPGTTEQKETDMFDILAQSSNQPKTNNSANLDELLFSSAPKQKEVASSTSSGFDFMNSSSAGGSSSTTSGFAFMQGANSGATGISASAGGTQQSAFAFIGSGNKSSAAKPQGGSMLSDLMQTNKQGRQQLGSMMKQMNTMQQQAKHGKPGLGMGMQTLGMGMGMGQMSRGSAIHGFGGKPSQMHTLQSSNMNMFQDQMGQLNQSRAANFTPNDPFASMIQAQGQNPNASQMRSTNPSSQLPVTGRKDPFAELGSTLFG